MVHAIRAVTVNLRFVLKYKHLDNVLSHETVCNTPLIKICGLYDCTKPVEKHRYDWFHGSGLVLDVLKICL